MQISHDMSRYISLKQSGISPLLYPFYPMFWFSSIPLAVLVRVCTYYHGVLTTTTLGDWLRGNLVGRMLVEGGWLILKIFLIAFVGIIGLSLLTVGFGKVLALFF